MRGELFAWGYALRATRPLSVVLAGGMSLLAVVPPATTLAAEPIATVQQADHEKSILRSDDECDDNALDVADVAVASDEVDECPLEPITRSTGAEPDLAEGATSSTAAVASAHAGGALLETEDYDSADASDDADLDAELPADDPTTDDAAAEIRAASFNGVTPGETTREALVVEWGEPTKQTRGRLTFTFDNFPRVDVQVAAGVVTTIRVQLPEAVDGTALVQKLGLSDLRPCVSTSEDGAAISTSFPERGVTLLHQSQGMLAVASDAAAGAGDGQTQVFEIELAGVSAEPFIRRAASAPARAYAAKIADLQQALKLDDSSAEARYLLSQAQRAWGSAIAAEENAAAAVERDQANEVYRLHWGKCLKDLAQYDAAVEQTRRVLESTETSKLVRAQALSQMGSLAALGSRDIKDRVVPLHSKAIELADTLAAEGSDATRREANLILVDSHLAIAERLAQGKWQEKDDTIAQWIARASAIAEQMIADGQGDEGLRLKVAVAALRAGAKLDPPIDPTLWIAEAEQAAEAVKEKCDDDLGVAEVDWQLALAYATATEIQHRRGKPDEALAYGDQAEQLFGTLATMREELPDTGYIVGRLFFQIGAVNAVHRNDHATACEWYERALEPLLTPTPVTPEATPGQHGDALVSMGVSFWNQGERDRAYELTQSGLEMIQQGVGEGLLEPSALEVAQGNLAAMGRVLGKVELAATEAPQGKSPAAPQKTVATGKAKPSQTRGGQFASRNANGPGNNGARRNPTQVARRNAGGTQLR